MTARTPALVLIALLLTAGGGACGALWAWMMQPSALPPAVQGGPEDAQTQQERRALREAVEALTAALEAHRGPLGGGLAEPRRDPVADPGPDPVPGTQEGEATPATAPEVWPAVGLSAAATLPTGEQRQQLGDLARSAVDGRPERHLFASYREILQLFGRPDEVNGDSSMRWFYRDPNTGGLSQLVFCEGLLIAVYP